MKNEEENANPVPTSKEIHHALSFRRVVASNGSTCSHFQVKQFTSSFSYNLELKLNRRFEGWISNEYQLFVFSPHIYIYIYKQLQSVE